MAVRRCNECKKDVLDIEDRNGNKLELTKYAGQQLWATKYETVQTLTGPERVAVAYRATAFVLHECERQETLAAPVKVQEFPSIGDPV